MKIRHILTLAILAISAAGLAQTAQTTPVAKSHIRYVTAKGAYSNNGSSWQQAKNNIQEAINDLVATGSLPGEVWVAEGKYRPSESTEIGGGSSLYASFKVPAGVTVRGGFRGPDDKEGYKGEQTLNERMVAYYDKTGKEIKEATVDVKISEQYATKRYKYHTVLTGDLTGREATFSWNAQRHRFATQFYGNTYHVVWFATKWFL